MTVDEALAKEKGLSATEGVYVESVDKGGQLDAAGVEEGDVITAVDGKKVTTKEELEEILAGKEPGDELDITVDRNGKSVTYSVEVGEDLDPANASGAFGLGNSLSFDERGDDGIGGGNGSGNNAWVLPASIVGLLLLLGVAALVWWLMRRRNGGASDDDDDFWEEVPASA